MMTGPTRDGRVELHPNQSGVMPRLSPLILACSDAHHRSPRTKRSTSPRYHMMDLTHAFNAQTIYRR